MPAPEIEPEPTSSPAYRGRDDRDTIVSGDFTYGLLTDGTAFEDCGELTIVASFGSCAAAYCIEKGIPLVYRDEE